MVLVVDDHDDTRGILVYLLNRDGYQTVSAANGAEAMSLMTAKVPKLVLLDYTMPEMDGLAVVAAMKAEPSLRDVPIIMFSALNGDLKAQSLRAGVNSFVLKGSLDWSHLQSEVLRLAGPGDAPIEMPPVPQTRSKDVG